MDGIVLGGNTVFVGNIPYDGTEQQLIDVFSSVGTVVSFRLVSDRETGKPKGYGFCEFKDPEVAKSAIRNLNGVDFHGRSLRVDFAADEKGVPGIGGGVVPDMPMGPPGPSSLDESQESFVQQFPIGSEALGQVIAGLKEEEKVEILSQMKILTQQNPEGAKQLLNQNPQLAQAILRIQIGFGLVKSDEVASYAVAPEVPPPMMAQPPTVPLGVRRPMPPGPPPMAQPPIAPPMMEPHMGMPPAPAVPGPVPAPAPGPLSQLAPDQLRQLERILSLPAEQIAKLPPHVQAQVQALKANLAQRPAGPGGAVPPPGYAPPRRY